MINDARPVRDPNVRQTAQKASASLHESFKVRLLSMLARWDAALPDVIIGPGAAMTCRHEGRRVFPPRPQPEIPYFAHRFARSPERSNSAIKLSSMN